MEVGAWSRWESRQPGLTSGEDGVGREREGAGIIAEVSVPMLGSEPGSRGRPEK